MNEGKFAVTYTNTTTGEDAFLVRDSLEDAKSCALAQADTGVCAMITIWRATHVIQPALKEVESALQT